MKEFLQSIFKTTEDRVKNPFIGSFITSWVLFNWKPIVFIILSSQIIEDKIKYIETEFSNIVLVLLLPLLAAIFYVLILPFLNLLFDELLKFPLVKRNAIQMEKQKQKIDNETQIAIEEIKREEAKTEYREKNTHNKLVEELQEKNKQLQDDYENEKKQDRLLIDEFKSRLNHRDEMANDEQKIFEMRYSELRAEMKELNNMIFDKDKQIQELQRELMEKDMKENEKVIIKFENGLHVIEEFDGKNRIYTDADNGVPYTELEVDIFKNMHKYEVTRRRSTRLS
ncbi:MAG: hypothetical protein V4538_12255 [Bacteroidota bacterium]